MQDALFYLWLTALRVCSQTCVCVCVWPWHYRLPHILVVTMDRKNVVPVALEYIFLNLYTKHARTFLSIYVVVIL